MMLYLILILIVRDFRSVLTSAPSTRSSRSRRSSRPLILERYHIISLKHLLATTELPTRWKRPPWRRFSGSSTWMSPNCFIQLQLSTDSLSETAQQMCLSINTLIWKSTLIVELSESWSLTFLFYRSPNLSKRLALGLKSPDLHKSWQHCQWPQWYRNISTLVIWMDKDGSSKSIYNPNISMDLIWRWYHHHDDHWWWPGVQAAEREERHNHQECLGHWSKQGLLRVKTIDCQRTNIVQIWATRMVFSYFLDRRT